MFDKLFGRRKKNQETSAEPSIAFGRYSDNNKPVAKVNRWREAENLFKEKKYPESFDAFFDYLRDDEVQNLVYERTGAAGRFQFYQGSKMVRGSFDGEQLNAEVMLARMQNPSVPVMRRLLEMNFNLFYSRFAMDNEHLCMRFDSETKMASPSKLYYGLKELSTKADKQDDLLLQDFTMLEPTDTGHVMEVPLQEKEVKFQYLQKWITDVLNIISGLDAEKFSGGIAYTLLSLVYRIDYLITPEGKLLNDLEKIAAIFFKKDERPVIEKNRDIADEFKKIQALSKQEVFNSLIHSKYTFSIVSPKPYKIIADSIHAANQNLVWYRDNHHPQIACWIAEYGISYCQYSYSLPKVITELYHLFMMVNYSDYFKALGFKKNYYNPDTGLFDSNEIIESIQDIQSRWKEKYPKLDFKTGNLRFDNLVNFNHSFTNEMEFLDTNPK